MSGSSPNLVSTWAVQARAGEPLAVVSVRNLQSIVYVGHDAWGRPQKAQPMLISASISFAQLFKLAAANDRLGDDTVHYGSLSKAILEGIREWTIPIQDEFGGPTAVEVLDDLWCRLTGKTIEATAGVVVSRIKVHREPFLSAETKEGVRSLSVTITFPKASLLGSGVSLTATSVFGEPGMSALALRLDSLRVPTLIGVNDNERLAKQVVVVSITIEKLGWTPKDFYTELEALVVQTLEKSAYETLEALGIHIADTIAKSYSCDSETEPQGTQPWGRFWDIHVRMEKPTAVPLADCPIVEVRRVGHRATGVSAPVKMESAPVKME
ncbi:hypothetical protein B0H67DRAFT_475635 [Lasiosphaeris hirsuta]|uniref:dihydroneopterin aldolase n=1 Tax=Lasiosphaeris hirsuta TaxID=260670 RepID=A0AA40EB30_9PEZI|nr:hypothetical protein B0H67DRAFT_475635 [Lasiosphaeris hirsuta]